MGQEGLEAFELGVGGIPHYKVYDEGGRLRYTFNSFDKLERKIDELLNET